MAITRKKIVIAFLIVLALGIFLPPNINGARFSKRLASTLSAALGREVKIGSVKYRLLPRPGFDLYDLQVMDDPAFSAEPLLMCGKVTADLRLTSLWQGRLEIANLKLTDDSTPPSLNLVYSGDHWNLESLLLRVEQVPTAPTAKRSAEHRSRFPYIQASSGRI
ncbi:MAG TPA: AsmA family protein, partial [Candidatus Sulfotelmatobacter sp.]|nr:AsmA family protein [Candidatus Sulfotelmatobacter sp.]